ncbi:hypothetical protein ABN09_11125, partial [Morganella morganii]
MLALHGVPLYAIAFIFLIHYFCIDKTELTESLMSGTNLIKQLQERGLIAQVTDEKALAERLAQGPISLYCGFDPTADSLH